MLIEDIYVVDEANETILAEEEIPINNEGDHSIQKIISDLLKDLNTQVENFIPQREVIIGETNTSIPIVEVEQLSLINVQLAKTY